MPFIPFLVSGALFFPYITTKAFAWRIIIEVIFAAWIVLAALDPAYRPKRSIILYSFIAFITVIGIADLFGVAPVKSFWSNYERMEGFVSLLHLGAFFLVAGSIFSEIDWKRWWKTSLVAAFIMSIYCLFQLAGAITINQGGVRIDGTFGNASYLAVYMLFHVFISLLFFIRTRDTAARYIYGIFALLFSFMVYETATRGAILGLLGGLFVIALLNLRNKENAQMRKMAVATLVLICLTVGSFIAFRNSSFVLNSPVLARFANLNIESIRGEGRAYVWPIALAGIKERPLLGWGQENFNYVFNAHYNPEMYQLEPWFDRAHNIFLDWGIAGGIVGLLAYLALYIVLVVSIWKRKAAFSYAERTVLSGLLAAYFFHNLFVFDHLVSYVLFASFLAYVHGRVVFSREGKKRVFSERTIAAVIAPAVAVVLIVVFFVTNVQPIRANGELLEGLRNARPGSDPTALLGHFKKAYEGSRLGRPEVVEHTLGNTERLLSEMPESGAGLIAFARTIAVAQAEELPNDARYQFFAGAFLSNIGEVDNALRYLNRAVELSPGKQSMYFEIGTLYINSGNITQGLEVLKYAYDMAPLNPRAKIAYLVGVIYADDAALTAQLIKDIPADDLAVNDQVLAALVRKGNTEMLSELLKRRIELSPKDPQSYATAASLFMSAGQKEKAIQALTALAVALPEYKIQADAYIQSIQNNTFTPES